MEDRYRVHLNLDLFTTPDKFYMQPSKYLCLYSYTPEVLVIDRRSGEASVQNIDLVELLGPEANVRLIFGFLGSIKLISGLYLVVVTDPMLLGYLNGHFIYQLLEAEMIPYAQSTTHLTRQQIEDNEKYLSMVRMMLDLPGAYLSCSHDLTHTQQYLHTVTPDFFKKPLASRADPRFLWNRYLLKDFMDEQFGHFALPIIQGFLSKNYVKVNGHELIWSLVSRRSVHRTGTKLYVRGIDDQGNVANHVITEQVIEYGGKTCSFLLTRGSVPLPWTQYPDLSFIPKVHVAEGDHVTTFVKHMQDQQRRYGSIVCINLLSHRGKEGRLEEDYCAAATAANLPDVKYRPFDFHAECRSLGYDKLDKLIHNLGKELKEFGFFYSEGGSVVQRQSGTFRVNCLDCLDRTNVVQSVLSKIQLKAMLKQLAITTKEDEQLPELDCLINNVWADHADMLSNQYSGTCALMTDLTRTGKRTYTGIISDVANVVVRYYTNNFSDGFKQDAFDVYLGNYIIPEGNSDKQTSLSRSRINWRHITFPSIFLAAVGMFYATISLSKGYNSETLLNLIFWGTIAATTLYYIRRSGKEFVDRPILCSGELQTPACKMKTKSAINM